MARLVLWVEAMTPTRTAADPTLISPEVLRALGLERRHSRGRDIAVALGIAAVGAILGAGAVLLRAGVVSLWKPKPDAATS